MSNIIHTNKTRYSSSDIEELFTVFLVWLKSKVGEDPSMQLSQGGNVSYHSGGRSTTRPITLAYWTSPWDKGDRKYASSLSFGHSDEGHIGAGPWFVKNCYPTDESLNLNVRTPNNAMECLSPVEALASNGKMPRAMMSQLLFSLLPLVGYRIQKKQHGVTNFRYDRPLYKAMMDHAKKFVESHPDVRVRVLKNVEHKVTPASKQAQLKRLVGTFESGSAASDLKWKVWAIRNQCDELHASWVKNYKQLQRVLSKSRECNSDDSYREAFIAVSEERRLSKMLRQLADQHEAEELREINAASKEEK